ncbi:MAG TPA: isocitrate lyase/phosphoenolpyruvate mutase family protein [Acetobacteraceae bacterium]|nr:isocitrate lyase/phosphoenolpyruvate mutase family protein [Acetobacteraceae bacterium]
MTVSQSKKAERFAALHKGPGTFIIANAWDAGSARILSALGFVALATSSGAAAGVLGKRDGTMTRDESLTNARAIAAATDLPVSADLEHAFADSPEAVATTFRLAAGAGLVGASIEDATGDPARPLFPIEEAAERVAAAVGAARKLPFPFTVTARAENFFCGKPDLDDTIKRLQAYEKAGADVLMAPGLPDMAAVRTVCASLSRPFSFTGGIKGRSFPIAALAEVGVRRVSLATSLYRAAMNGLVTAAREVRDEGGFGYVENVLTTPELYSLMGN